ncbi:MAG: ABC transporter substrate-binding protein [Desulfobacteraceae bacterium]|nr:ABC transporter substrate-binding protein [Desulfobacteraceae bacterium]
MKKTLVILLLIILVVTVAYILSAPDSPLKKETVYIAAAGPMSDSEGSEMCMGINLYLDEINKKGGINGKKIKLLEFDDKNDSETAKKIAKQIAGENMILTVLGHYYSSASIPAGNIYRKNEIPVINASGFAEAVTFGNEWSFRIVPNTKVLGGFAANYISKSMKKNSAGIIAAGGGSSGAFLAESFEKTSEELGLKLINTWFLDRKQELAPQVKKIVSEIKTDKPEAIFLATSADEGAEITATLKQEKINTVIMGWHEIGTDSFADMMKEKYPEKANADVIYFISSFMSEIADEKTYKFVREYKKKYNKKPSWVAACYYDAAKVAVKAFKKAGIRGKYYLREDRRKIRNALEGFYSRENGIRGVTGYIYFDENGDINKPPVIGVFQNYEQVPAFNQYRQYTGIEETNGPDMINKIIDGDFIAISGEFMSKFQLVYTGTDIIEAGPMDMIKSECPMDFYIWFRFSGDFNDADIEFTNSIGPVKLGKPVKEEKSGSTVKRTYRVKAVFKCDFNFRDYPFDSQTVPIRFHHAELTDSKLIYVPDTIHLPRSFNISAGGWKKNSIKFYQDVSAKQTTLGNPDFFEPSQHIISYSQFNTEIRLTRNSPVLNFKYFFPITAMVMMLIYAMRFAGPGQIRHRIISIMAVLVICMGCQIMYFSEIAADYLTGLDFVFIAVYTLASISVFVSVYSYSLHIKRKPGLWLAGTDKDTA